MTTTINLNVEKGLTIAPAKAVQRGALAINAAVYTRGDGQQSVNGYAVTHVPTGLAICRCRSVWKARRALRALLKCGDWNIPTGIVDGQGDTSSWPPAFRKRALIVAKRFHERTHWSHP